MDGKKETPDPQEIPFKGDTEIGNDVWIGFKSVIMPGISIGDGAVVGARSVVTRDIPPFSIVAGNPANVVRMRFSPEIINELLKIRWWDWSIDKITANLKVIVGGDINALKRIFQIE